MVYFSLGLGEALSITFYSYVNIIFLVLRFLVSTVRYHNIPYVALNSAEKVFHISFIIIYFNILCSFKFLETVKVRNKHL